ncbi:MAG: AraC family transcriptional regulator [Verrucomicrobiaceae bacterium]|nr:MAG: AraC family transcriptional regulator [Verrucomicrobiaceae bacterium]
MEQPSKKSGGPQQDRTFDSPGTQCWYLTAEDCPLMVSHGLARVGIDDTAAGYRRVRLRPAGSFILETSEGEGRVFLEGKWQKTTQGEVVLAPPRVLNAFRTAEGQHWKIAYVRYNEPAGVKPLVDSGSPLRQAGHIRLGLALAGLRDEWDNEREPTMLRHWLAIIDAIARRLARPWRMDQRLWQLWNDVEAAIDADWPLHRLASHAGLSAEHLRRTCLAALGRSPIEHLTYLRVQRAQDLLESGDDKIEVIARKVGYTSGHAFSRAFQRCVGLLPSEFRQPHPH